MVIFRRILAFAILTVLAIAFTAFYVRWERAGNIIRTSELPSYQKSFSKNDLSDPEVLIGEIVFGSHKGSSIGNCPSFKRLKTKTTQVDGPSHHLARLILWEQKPNRALDFHIDSLFLACRLERDYTQDILWEYTLSKVYLGDGQYGVESASLSLFSKAVDQLSGIEVFEIAILIKQPSYRDNDEARRKRAHALMERFVARESADHQTTKTSNVKN